MVVTEEKYITVNTNLWKQEHEHMGCIISLSCHQSADYSFEGLTGPHDPAKPKPDRISIRRSGEIVIWSNFMAPCFVNFIIFDQYWKIRRVILWCHVDDFPEIWNFIWWP